MGRLRQPNPRDDEVLAYITAYKVANDGLSPSFREIGEAVGISSTSQVSYYLQNLERDGLIKVRRDTIRGIMVTGGRWMSGDPGDTHNGR